VQGRYCCALTLHCFAGHLNTDAVFSAPYFPKTDSRSKLSFHFSPFFTVVVVVVEVVVLLAVNVVETVDEFSVVSLLPLTVTVVMVLPSGDTTVLVSENSFFIFLLLILESDIRADDIRPYLIILKQTVFEFISGS